MGKPLVGLLSMHAAIFKSKHAVQAIKEGGFAKARLHNKSCRVLSDF